MQSPQTEKPLICPRSPGYWYGSQSGIHALGCKSRQCEVCQKYWSTRWRIALNFKSDYDKAMLAGQGVFEPKVYLTMTLTFHQYASSKVVYNCLRYFWQILRAEIKEKIGYFKCVEFNQKHTLPHLHFILEGVDFIYYKKIRRYWLKAQKWAGIELRAFDINIQEIQKSMAAYLSKYLTKAGKESKDEIPRRDIWKGRYVSYSPGFFPLPLEEMLKVAQLQRQLETNAKIDRVFVLIDKTSQYLETFTSQVQKEWSGQVEAVNYEWDYKKDILYSESIGIDLFDICGYDLNWYYLEWDLTSLL